MRLSATLLLAMQLAAFAQSNQGTAGNPPATAVSPKNEEAATKGRILGIGGIFFKSADPAQARQWYATHLGLADKGQGAILPWRDAADPQVERKTAWAVFPAATRYFDPGKASFMVNYIVDDMDALLGRLEKEGVRIDPSRQDTPYGRFAWIYDADGNKIELWQAPAPKK